jgi:hypothetical protein
VVWFGLVWFGSVVKFSFLETIHRRQNLGET